jgi:hypothetical protein
MTHPSFEIFLGYVEETLSPEARREVENHLSLPCRDCERQIAQLRRVAQAIRGDETISPPPQVLNQVMKLYRQHMKEVKPSGVQVIAQLLFDSRLQPSAAMVRGSSQTRRILYSAQQVEIDLQVTPDQGFHNMIGQVLDSSRPEEFTQAFVSMRNNQTGEFMEGKETDLLGQFNFLNIPPGQYDLVFELDTQEVTIRSLDFINAI